MTKRLGIIFVIFWLAILFIGKSSLQNYQQSLINQEPVIRSYIDACVSNFPFNFCRLVYNKISFALPERILSLLDPLSVENILLKSSSAIFLVFFPFYILGVFALFYKFKKYFLITLIIFTALLINLVLHLTLFISFLAVPLLFFIGAKEFIALTKTVYV